MTTKLINVLIIDDHEIIRRGLKDILSDHFLAIKFGEAGSSHAALELAAAQAYDLVLLDISIPGRDGLELISEIKTLQPSVPILILSIYPEHDYGMRAFKAGASGYLTKDRASEELLTAVDKVLRGGKYVTESLAERLVSQGDHSTGRGPRQALSNRELQILRLVAGGKTLKAIAAELSLSEKTVGTYRRRLSEKTGLSTNVELTRYAFQNNLLDL